MLKLVVAHLLQKCQRIVMVFILVLQYQLADFLVKLTKDRRCMFVDFHLVDGEHLTLYFHCRLLAEVRLQHIQQGF